MATRDLKFHKLITKIDAKYTPKQLATIKDLLNSDNIKFQLSNPFIIHPFPSVNADQIPYLILFLARQMEEVNIKNLNLGYLQHFVANNFDLLLKVLNEKSFHCQLFCLAFIQYLQQHTKTKELNSLIGRIRTFPFIDLFSALLQKRKSSKINKPIKSEEKDINHQIHTIFNALLFSASMKYVKQPDEQELQENKFLERSLNAACLVAQQSQNQMEWEAVREYLSITSYLLVFNGLAMRPIKLLDFCLDNNQGLYFGKEHNQQVKFALVQKYLRSLSLYSKNDASYQVILLKIIKNLLTLNINNSMLITHFEILLELIRGKQFPLLKKQIFDILIESQSKRNIAVIDQMFLCILGSGIDLLDDQVQRFTLALAESGDNKRKEQFTTIYYFNYEQSFNMIHQDVVNFILQVYLDQNLPLEKVQFMVSKEAFIIKSSVMQKLHSVISEKKSSMHLTLLNIILEKRRDQSFKENNKVSNFPFISEEWLQCSNGDIQVYKMYLKLLTETLCGKTLEIYPALINLSSCNVKIQAKYFIRSLEFYSIILKAAEKCNIFEESVFRYMVLLQAIFGHKLSANSYSYFSKNFSKIIHPQSTFLMFLQYLTMLLKNKSAVLLYLQAVLEFQMNLNDLFYEKNLFDISFLARLVEESEYFRLSTYSLESVTVLYELSLIIKNKHFQQDFSKIIKCWSRIMTRAECKNITYFFAFREIKKIYPFMKEREMKTPSDRIRMVWDLILGLIDYKDETKEYISMAPNDLVITWRGEDNTKKELKIEGCMIRNQNMDLTWRIIIETSAQKTYILSINYDRVVVEVCYTKQQNNIIKELRELLKDTMRTDLKKRPENVRFQLKIDSNSKKILVSFSILQKQLQAMFFEGNVQHIKIVCKDNAILKDIKITDLTNTGELTELKSHSQMMNQWEIRIASFFKYKSENFSDKFDFTHAYCCIGEMLRHFSHVNLPFAYDIFVRLSVKLMKCLNKADIPLMLQMMVQVFNTIEESYSTLRGRNRALTPTFEAIDFKMYPIQLYYLFTSALLPLPFWDNFSEQTKTDLTKLLNMMLNLPSFREIENNKLELFDKSLQISRQQQSFFEICKTIIENHDKNDLLTIKFKRIIFLAGQSSIYEKLFSNFLEETLKYLNFSNEQYVNQLALCKFLIFGSECVRQIFHFCKMNSKTDLLHYISQNPSFNVKGQHNSLNLIKELISVIGTEDRHLVLPWLITEVKQLIFNKRMKLKSVEQNKYDYRVHYLYLQLLLLNRHIGSEDQHENQEKEKLTLGLIKILKDDAKQQNCKAELQAFFHSSTYMNFFINITKEILEKYGNINKADKKDLIVEIYDLSLDIIMRFEKKTFLQFIIKYRSKCKEDCLLHKALIEYEKLKNLRLSHQSIMLQYIFEVLLLIEYGRVSSITNGEQLIGSIKQYIEFLFHSFDQKTKVSKSLFYNYPKLAGHREGMSDTNRVMRRIRKPTGLNNFLQLRGGIYFKCILITLKLMKLTPNQDYSNIIDYFIFGPKRIKEDRGLLAIINDLQSKERSSAQLYYLDANEEHKLYYNKQDVPYNNKSEDIDLTLYITDYFLMSIAEFLYKQSSKIDPQLLKKYSFSFCKGISNSKISKEIHAPITDYYQITCYEDIQRLVQKQNEVDCNSTPSSTSKRINFSEESFSMREIEWTGSPTRRNTRRKTVDQTSENKRKIQNIELIKSDQKNWYKSPNSKNISAYFGEKAKEIRIIELIHTHYTLSIDYFQSDIIPSSKLKQREDTFINKYLNSLKDEKKQISLEGRINIEEKSRKVKKIHPYTSAKPPVFNIIQNCLPNIACPITLKITKKDYSIRRFKSQESLNMNYYLTSRKSEEDYTQILEEQLEKCNEFQRQYSNKMAPTSLTSIAQGQQFQTVHTREGSYCEWVTRQGVFFCQYFIESSKLSLETKMDRPTSDKLWYLKLGTPTENLLHTVIKVEILPQDVIEIFYRKFNQITNNSLQFFMKNGTSKFISFYRKEDLSSVIKSIEKLFKGVKIIKDTVKQFQELKYTEKWTEGLISNFDYLMLLNKFSGRTYNDLNQYFVFPWVLTDYHSNKIDLSNPDIYRDLSKPVGALNPDKLKRYKDKYRSEVQNNERVGQRCLYGSHYSTSLFIFYYLVRLEPYSSLHREMQKGNFDVADRLFNSIDQVWESLMSESNATDIKECIPQFYYMPAFLRNIAHIQLGQKQCGEDVEDVQLPPWAKNAQQFIVTLRAALESDYVSEHLHLWIDLIFGKYQNSQQKHNIFHPFCYSDPEVLNKISNKNHKHLDGIICQISYFGQCPLQLFKKEHKPKKLFAEVRTSRSDKGNSESTTSQIVSGQVLLPNIWKITKIIGQNTDFTIELQHLTKQDRQSIVIPANATPQILKSSTETFIPIKKNDIKVSNESKIATNNKQQIYIGKEFLMELDIKFHFEHVQICDLWISCFGSKGIRIYNWQLEQYWSWQVEEVKQVHLEPTRLIFSTPSGKVYFYSFFDRKIQQTIVFKQICDMSMKIICLPRLPSPSHNKNEIHYKVLCIGDGVRLSIISYTFEETCNATSSTN